MIFKLFVENKLCDDNSLEIPNSLSEDNGNNHTIKTEGLTEDKNQNHSDEDLFLLGICSDTCITDDSNTETGSLYDAKVRYSLNLRVMIDHRLILRRDAYIPLSSCKRKRQLEKMVKDRSIK